MESVTDREKQFYIDQITTRQCRVSEEIDEEYEKEKETECQERYQQEERDKLEEAFISQE